MDVLRLDAETAELRLGASLLRARDLWMLLVVAVGLPLILLAGLIYTVSPAFEGPFDIVALMSAIWAEMVKEPGHRAMLWVSAALLPVGILSLVLQRRAWVRVTPAGLEASLPRLLGLFMFGQTTGRWQLRWDEVRRIRLAGAKKTQKAAQKLGSYCLIIETERGETRLKPFRWFDCSGQDHRLRLPEIIFPRTLDAVQRLQSAPLVGAFRARGLDIDVVAAEEGEQHPAGFNLARHRGLLAQVGLLFGAGLYALGDTFIVEPYQPLEALPLWPFAAVGIVIACAARQLGCGAPRIERLSVGSLAVAACIAATYPAMLRLNASTAEAESVVFVSGGGGRFEAPEGRLPPIDLSGKNLTEYWTQYPPGAEHEFTLLRGRAGFYQLALAPFYERTRQFYRERIDGN